MYGIQKTVAVAVAALMVTVMAGCGTQQFGSTSRELMKPLQTAVSAKKSEWVDATEKKILAQRDDGKITDAEYQALNGVILQSRSGNWKGAKESLFKLMEGQRPSAQDLAQLSSGQKNKVVEDHRNEAKKRRK